MPHIFTPLISLFTSNANQSAERKISVGNRILFDEGRKYPNNKVITNKYSFWNFLPKNLFEQFHRIANFYFLVVTLISFFVDTSVTAFATLLPLLFVVSVTAIKQGYEDWLRYRTDQMANHQPCLVIRNGALAKIRTSDIEIGDVIKVEKDEDIPCDMVILSSSEEDGSCYITTVNMDGETNLKIYSSPSETASLTSVESINLLEAIIECEHPTLDLYKFIGRMNIKSIGQVPSQPAENPGSTDEHLTTSSSRISLSASNLLLRGTRLKNTNFVFGCAVYTGQETKIFLNTLSQEHKVSKIEKKMNTFMIFYIVVLVVISLLWVLWIFLFSFEEEMMKENVWYMKNMEDFTWKIAVREFFVFLVLFNYILPISMYVTIELQKFFGSVFFEWDIDLYDPEMDERAKANTSDLNEELGQIQYLFTDKTGTLTENLMQFRQLFVDGKYYKEEEGKGLLRIEEQTKEEQSTKVHKAVDIEGKLEDMLICLALCHTVRVDRPKDDDVDGGHCQRSYQSASPDEKALVEACARLGVAYLGSENGKVKLSICHSVCPPDIEMNESTEQSDDAENNSPTLTTEIKTFALKHVLEFESCRKRMAVIVEELDPCPEDRNHGRNNDDDVCRTSNVTDEVFCTSTERLDISSNSINKFTSIIHQVDHQERQKGYSGKGTQSPKFKSKGYRVICKGAETAVFEGVSSGDVAGVEASVNRFAEMGYRTLVVASKRINESQFEHYDRLLRVARNALEKREEKVTEAYCLIENQFEVLGATAVEDRLQDQVKETIEAMRMAEIKVWVLTGDKEETAVNISYSAGHMTKDMNVFSLTKQISPGSCQDCLVACKEHFETIPKKKRALVIDGKTLSLILSDAHRSQLLLSLSQECMAVLCCRLSPIQKAELVRMIKNSKGEPTTAAIGDGANDVNMIREAHVGIGIMGKEGRQATRAADFAIARFKHLRKVILVHGHYFYVRLSVLVMYFFFKNVALTGMQAFYTPFAAFSAQTLFSSYYLMFYNTSFTALPIILYGIFEQHLSVELLMRKPSLYRHIRNNKLMNAFHFAKWNLLGVWHSFAYFFGTYFAICEGASIFLNGWDLGIFDAGAIAMTACVIAVNLKLSIESYLFNWMIVAGYVVSIFGYYIVTVPMCKFLIPTLTESIINHGSLTTVMESYTAWLVTLLVVVVALLPDILMRALRNTFDGLYSSPIKWQGDKKRMKEDCQFLKVDIELISHKSGLTTSPTLTSFNSFYGSSEWKCSPTPPTKASIAQFLSINNTNNTNNNTNKSTKKVHSDGHIPPACDSNNQSSHDHVCDVTVHNSGIIRNWI